MKSADRAGTAAAGARPLSVALVGNYPPPYGGVSVHVQALARFLRRRGIAVRVYDLGEGDHDGDGVRPARGALRYARALAAAAARGELVHVHTSGANPKSWLVALGAAHARRLGGPRGVLTIHSGLCPAYLAASPVRRRVAAAACDGFGRIIAVNGHIAAALEAAGAPPDRIDVLPAFSSAHLDVGALPPAMAPFRAAHEPLFCAALAEGPTYGEDLLGSAFAAALARFPGAGLVVFGPGARHAHPPAVDPDAVLDLGEIPHAAALAAIAACDVFVRPTRADGDAVSVREALALGRPVVASAVGYRPAGCLLFQVGDAGDLALRMAEAAATRAARPGAEASARDPLEAILATYRALWAGAPLPSDGRGALRAPNF